MKVTLRSKVLTNGRKSLYLDFTVLGKRHKEYLNLYLEKGQDAKTRNKETIRLADNVRAKRQLELEHDQHGFVPKFKREANFIEYFERTATKKHRSWQSVLLQLKEYSNGYIPFSKIDERWIEGFQDFLLERVSNNTAITYCNKLKACLNLACRDRIIADNPYKRVLSVKKIDSERVYLTIEELNKLAATPCNDAEVKRAFLFCCYTGLRFSDVSQLLWSNINQDSIHFSQQKTSGREYLPLSRTALKLLGSPKSGDSKVFLLSSDWKTWGHLQTWSKKAEIDKHISFHVSRHTFAVLSLSNNVDIYTLSKLLGHTGVRNTEIYAKIIDQKKIEAVESIPSIEI